MNNDIDDLNFYLNLVYQVTHTFTGLQFLRLKKAKYFGNYLEFKAKKQIHSSRWKSKVKWTTSEAKKGETFRERQNA